MINLANSPLIDGLIIWAGTLSWFVFDKEIPSFLENCADNPDFLKIQSFPENTPVVIMDSYGGMKKIMNHLIKVHRKKRIAFISGSETHLGAKERYRAYCNALKENDLPFDSGMRSHICLAKKMLKSPG